MSDESMQKPYYLQDIAFEQEQKLSVQHYLNYPLLRVKHFVPFLPYYFWITFHIGTISYFEEIDRKCSIVTFEIPLSEKKPLFKPPLSHLYAEEENGTTEVKTEADVEVVSAQGTEVVLQGEPTEESVGVAVEESTRAVSNGGSDEQVGVQSETETETESEDYAEGDKEDVEVHEQVAESAGVEAMRGGFLEGSEEESDDETETYGDDAEGQNVTEEESG